MNREKGRIVNIKKQIDYKFKDMKTKKHNVPPPLLLTDPGAHTKPPSRHGPLPDAAVEPAGHHVPVEHRPSPVIMVERAGQYEPAIQMLLRLTALLPETQ